MMRFLPRPAPPLPPPNCAGCPHGRVAPPDILCRRCVQRGVEKCDRCGKYRDLVAGLCFTCKRMCANCKKPLVRIGHFAPFGYSEADPAEERCLDTEACAHYLRRLNEGAFWRKPR